jgi:radical SAM superfamily enzyme YgiQ (UPF0313 family)
MFNILFYHANYISKYTFTSDESVLYLSTSSLYLKTHFELNHSDIADQVNWMLPIQKRLGDEELIDICNQNQVDFLCTSHYIWNHEFLRAQLNRIKKKLPNNCKIVVGGPSIDVHIEKDFFDKNSYADYAIYGPGEHAFAELLTHTLKNKKIIPFNVSNLSWYDTDTKQQIITDYKYVPQSKISPFLFNKDFFTRMVNYELEEKITICLPYSLTRGCPYSCTFCDWNSGLSNKVSRRKNTFKEEIDLFQNLKIKSLFLADANFGQYNEDIEIVEYLAYKNLNENTDFKLDGNFSKLQKDNNLKMFHIMAKGHLIPIKEGLTFSVQDINEQVLDNIERPDVGWDTHKNMILELYQCYPEIKSKIQIIVGLPGQTVDSLKESLNKISEVKNLKLILFINELLPASPAALNNEYQKKYNFTYSTAERLSTEAGFFSAKIPKSCFSFDSKEFVDMIIIASFYSGLFRLREEIKYNDLPISYIIDKLIDSDFFKLLKNNLYSNWQNDKFYYTIDLNNKDKIISACEMTITGSLWVMSKTFLKFLLKELKNDKMFTSLLFKNRKNFSC